MQIIRLQIDPREGKSVGRQVVHQSGEFGAGGNHSAAVVRDLPDTLYFNTKTTASKALFPKQTGTTRRPGQFRVSENWQVASTGF